MAGIAAQPLPPSSCCNSCMQRHRLQQPQHSFAARHRVRRTVSSVHVEASGCPLTHAAGSASAFSRTMHAAMPDALVPQPRLGACRSGVSGAARKLPFSASRRRASAAVTADQHAGAEETDVVIVGGGLAGLGAAIALQKAGACWIIVIHQDHAPCCRDVGCTY